MGSLYKAVLVLNKNWQVVRIETAKHALVKVFTEAAKIVDGDYSTYTWSEWFDQFSYDLEAETTYECITASKCKVRLPKTIVLTGYDKLPNINVKLTRKNLLIRDGFKCQYTGKRLTLRTATIDHILPRSRGGKTTWDNVVSCSIEANLKKANKTPQEANMRLLSEPRRPSWHPIYTYYVPKIDEDWKPFLKKEQWETFAIQDA